jgi:2-aminomuconate deaminase
MSGHGAMTAGEIASLVGLNLSTTHRFLLTLEEIGAVARLPGTKYHLGMLIAELGRRVTRHDVIAKRAHSVVQHLSQAVSETVNLATFDNLQVSVVAWSEPQRPLVFSSRRDRPMPLHASALGKTFLAGLPSLRREEIIANLPFEKLTPATITDIREFRREIDEASREGYARDRQEMELGLDCVAVPIVADDGGTMAALSVSAPSTRMNDGNIKQFLVPLRVAATRIRQSVLIENKILASKPKPLGSFPHVKRVGSFAFVSGISARRPDGTFAGTKTLKTGRISLDIYEQTMETIRNIADVLGSIGATLADVVEIQAFLVDMDHYPRFNAAYAHFFDYNGPTRTTVAAKALPHPHQLLMMKATAHVSVNLEAPLDGEL